ncbi:MAG: GHMP kinase [Euryarchaeota archaeon]|nr:GHMP kinase [Euryarchaeota archaeon]MBU4220096.1 GHMP kinase [Euryarchaeota archaeon]MBU4339893.1 GHMP kinase [Euryarchaeota archaeon]MBU4453632.1 GHMP kinase [Euryarchaeota archaeon]MCG2736912.1 pantoate kinase [Candidatus Methanoperedenaceae archaeon]
MQSRTSARAFAPAHISGIFIIDMKKDPLLSGSMGAGVCLEDGAVTSVRRAEETTVKINGAVSEAATTLSAIQLLTNEPVLVETELSIPVSAGLGASAAGALSAALAVNEALSLDLTFNDLANAAHVADVKNRTGLGDVAGMTCGGIDIRKHAGIPPVGRIDRIPCRNEIISWVSFGEISTRSVLSDEMNTKSINKAGRFRLKELIKKPTIDNFFRQSCEFAKQIDMMSPKVRDAIEAVEAAGGLASQAMLGDTVFAINDNGALSEFVGVRKSRISHVGAHLL